MNDRIILEALEKRRKPVPFVALVAELSPRDPSPLYERVVILSRHGFVSFSGQPETVSITAEGFSYLRDLRKEDYTKSQDRIARILACISIAIALAALIVSIYTA